LWWVSGKLRQEELLEAVWKCLSNIRETCEGVNCLVTLKLNLSAINPIVFSCIDHLFDEDQCTDIGGRRFALREKVSV
jgi:hypothetical protein